MDEQQQYEAIQKMADAMPKSQWTFVYCKQCGRVIAYEGIRVDVEHPKDCKDCEHWSDLK